MSNLSTIGFILFAVFGFLIVTSLLTLYLIGLKDAIVEHNWRLVATMIIAVMPLVGIALMVLGGGF